MHLNKSVYTVFYLWNTALGSISILDKKLYSAIPLAKIDNITNLPDISRLASA